MFLVINDSKKDMFEPYIDRYKLFTEPEDAVKFAIDCGYHDPFKLGINLAMGKCNVYMCGDVDVKIFVLEDPKAVTEEEIVSS